MIKFVTGLIGTLMMILFLGYYAISLNAIPLWIIILSVLAMVAWQFIETLKSGNDASG
ncbi:MAG: hypothetical protein R3322_08085 [Kiloniellales bacterium]|nr:hypothetical protein [Kiloniellales bacterium]